MVEAKKLAVEPTLPAGAPATLDTDHATQALPLAALLKQVHVQFGKSPSQLGADMFRRFWSLQKLMPDEYLAFRLFDDTGLSAEQKNAFAGDLAQKKLTSVINSGRSWDAVIDNKIVTEMVLGGFGFPVARTKAFVHESLAYPALTMLPNAAALAAYLRRPENYPLFGKPVNGSLSLGSAGLRSYEASSDSIRLMNGTATKIDDFVGEVFGSFASGYLLQDCLEQHPAVHEVAGPAISCVRFYTLVVDGAPVIFRSVWKLAAGSSMADNFWRGNLLAALDSETGRVCRVIQGKGIEQKVLDRHPDSGMSFSQFGVPDWAATKDLVLRAAACIEEVKLIGWDVAITANGPVVVETNRRPDLSLVQLAERRGILDETFLAAYRDGLTRMKEKKAMAKDVRRAHMAEIRPDLRTAVDVNAKID